jgi:hypothetical protein
MSAKEKSDLPEVAEKRANKAASAAAELVERRAGTKGNADQQSTRPRRSYRSSAGSRRAISVKIVMSFSGPSSVVSKNLTSSSGIFSRWEHLPIIRSAIVAFLFRFEPES